MRNLLGRLHARPAADIDRIAAFWRVPLSGNRHARIGALYRAMVDPATARDAWDRLQPDERAMVGLLASGDPGGEAPTLADLADRLGAAEAAVRETAVRLYRVGLLAREGDDDELPVGEAPRLFLPRELSLLFRRVIDEIALGDRSAVPLRALLEWLDDAELEAAAEVWGVPAMPGGRERRDVTERLLRQMADPERIGRVAQSLGRDARRLWTEILARPEGEPLSLTEAVTLLAATGDDPGAPGRWRRAVDDLERSLLVWHTYRRDGSRWLFAPREVRDPTPPPPPTLPPLVPVPPPADAPPARPPFALAWDLLMVLREARAEPWPETGEARPRLRAVNRKFWHAGPDLPPRGYLPFLRSLAVAEGLLEPDASRPGRLRLTAAARAWRDRSFAEQAAALRRRWLADPEWSEAADQGEVEVWGVDWRQARRNLMAALVAPEAQVEAGVWFALDALAARLAALRPDLLGPTFTAATARLSGEVGAGATRENARAAAIGEAVGLELRTAFAWFGLVEIDRAPAVGPIVRLTPAGAALARGEEPASPVDPPGPPLAIDADGALLLRRPSPARAWALDAIADLERLAPAPRYRMSEGSIRRALSLGYDLAAAIAFLERQAGQQLPSEVAERIVAWARGVHRVRLRPALLVVTDDDADAETVLAVAQARGWPAERLADGRFVVVPAGDDAEGAAAALAERGLTPLLADGPSV